MISQYIMQDCLFLSFYILNSGLLVVWCGAMVNKDEISMQFENDSLLSAYSLFILVILIILIHTDITKTYHGAVPEPIYIFYIIAILYSHWLH